MSVLTLLCVLTGFASEPASKQDAAAEELASLAGHWKIHSLEYLGKVAPRGEVPAISFTVRPDGTSTVRTPGGDFDTRSTVDATRSPKTIDIEYLGGELKGKRQYGIYRIDGDRWTVFCTPPDGRAEDRPREFDTTKAIGGMIVWERVKEESKR